MRITEALLRTIISESLREHMKPVGAVTTAWGKATVFYDPEVTLEENAIRVLEMFRSIPKRERMKSTAIRVEVYDNPEDVTRRLDDVGVYPDVLVNGAYDLRTGTLYTCTWDGYRDSPRPALHEFGHSVVGMDEEMAEAWAENYMHVVRW
jgi:hypothetical protein